MKLKLNESFEISFITVRLGTIADRVHETYFDDNLIEFLDELSLAKRDESSLVDEKITNESVELIHNAGILFLTINHLSSIAIIFF